jgi:hypothetical protein
MHILRSEGDVNLEIWLLELLKKSLKGRSCFLTIDHLRQLPRDKCQICDVKFGSEGHRNRMTWPVIGRIDLQQGFIVNNIRMLCAECNEKQQVPRFDLIKDLF